MKAGLSSRRRGLLLAAGVLAETVAMRARGHPIGGELIVRCQRCNLFTTLWIRGASFKAVRLGWVRFQWCPVGRHWSLVTPVRESERNAAEILTEIQHGDAGHARSCVWERLLIEGGFGPGGST